MATILEAASCVDHTVLGAQPGEEAVCGQSVQAFSPHFRAVRAPPTPLQLLWLGTVARGQVLEGTLQRKEK